MLPFGCLPHFSAWGGENSWMTWDDLVRRGHGRRGRPITKVGPANQVVWCWLRAFTAQLSI